MPSSIRLPFASCMTANVARRDSGTFPSTAAATAGAFAPETRTIPIPPRPGGVAIAAIVSRFGSAFAMGRFVALEHALDLPLLCYGKHVVDEPIEDQAGREEEKENAEHERHEHHHLGLDRIGW